MANKKKPSKRSVRKSSIYKVKSKAANKNKAAKKKKVVAKAKTKAPKRRVRGQANAGELVSYESRGLGARTGGQAGDTQGLAARPDVDSESVEELLEEGQSFEAEVVSGVESAPDPDQGEVRTRQVPENDVPEEYQEED
ncbi:MAG TPA: hypothetical protein VMU53_02155 [Candidatus Sulfotelmatobacter sp.]|nr:hypothetical protein [Candidatus Sulfotelmatobacter sp.]